MRFSRDGTHIGEEVVITLCTAKTADAEYLDGLINHLAKMKVDGHVYTDIKVLDLNEIKMKDQQAKPEVILTNARRGGRRRR